MKKIAGLLFMMLMTASTFASHIMGGYISVQHISGNQFTLKVVIWRDCINGAVSMPTSASIEMRDNVTNALVTTYSVPRISLTNVTLGDDCYTPTGLCVEEGIFQTTITINGNPNGYYLTWDDCCRNAIIDNLAGPSSLGMTFVCEIPDPALQNSSPDFGLYPADGYFCATFTKYIDLDITDPDGDSLSYSLVTPLNDDPVKPFTDCPWQAPYSLADIVGGTPVMNIDPVSGIIEAAPTALGSVFVFSVMVEEWRDTTVAQNGPKVKIGEVRRDVQYQTLNCSTDLPPAFLPFQDTIVDIVVGNQNCFDIISQDLDAQDTIYLELSSTTFAQGAFYGESPNIYGYWNSTTQAADTINLGVMTEESPGLWFAQGEVATRFCWQPECIHLDSGLFQIDALSYSLGCSGSDTAVATFYINVLPPPDATPIFTMQVDDIRRDTAFAELCFDIIVQDPDVTDTVFLDMSSTAFELGGNATYSGGLYDAGAGSITATQSLNNPAGPMFYDKSIFNTGTIGSRFCWNLKCEDVRPNSYPLILDAYSIGYCGDTAFTSKTIEMFVDTIPNEFTLIPNVFTPDGEGGPNGEALNETFRIARKHEPCFDFMSVKIYSRWGQLVFESEDPDFAWDGTLPGGKDAQTGTYFVILEGQFAGDPVSEQFAVTLLRKN